MQRGVRPSRPWGQRIELIRREPSTAMTHVGNEEQPGKLHGVLEAITPYRHFLVVLDCAGRRRAWIAQSVVPNDLPVLPLKFSYVQGCRVGDHWRLVIETSDIGVEVKAQRVEVRIGWRDPGIGNLTKSQEKIPRGRSWCSYLPRRKAGRAHITAIVTITTHRIVGMILDHTTGWRFDRLPQGVSRSFVDLLEGIDLCRSEADGGLCPDALQRLPVTREDEGGRIECRLA